MSIRTKEAGDLSDANMGFRERAFAAAGAAFLSAILVNPLDIAKTRLQAQAAGVPHQSICRNASLDTRRVLPDLRCPPTCTHAVKGAELACPPECSRYKGTLDVFYKVIHQEGFTKLWRGTNASLALAIPTVGIYLPCYDVLRNYMEEFTTQNASNLTPYVPLVAGTVARSLACVSCYPIELARTRMQAFREIQSGRKLPGVWKTLLGALNPIAGSTISRRLQSYSLLWTGLGAQLARDVPFSAICWSTLEPMRREFLCHLGDGTNVGGVLGANFSAGLIAGGLAAFVTCPLDVAKTRRQIEKNHARALKMTTRQTLVEIWRDGGMKGLFAGVGPRVSRAGPSVGIVVSCYEIVKYYVHHTGRFAD